MQREVGVDDADQRDVGEMQALGDHLRADEDVNLADAEVAQDAAVILLPFQGIGVHAHDPRVREELGQGGLDLLRAQAGVANRRVAAFLVRADGRHGLDVRADVAAELLLVAMVSQRDAAIGAFGHEAAEGALQRGGVAPPVQEQDDLLLPFHPLGDGLLELRREDGNRLCPGARSGAYPRCARRASSCRPPARATAAACICPCRSCSSSPAKAWPSRAPPPRLPSGRAQWRRRARGSGAPPPACRYARAPRPR